MDRESKSDVGYHLRGAPSLRASSPRRKARPPRAKPARPRPCHGRSHSPSRPRAARSRVQSVPERGGRCGAKRRNPLPPNNVLNLTNSLPRRRNIRLPQINRLEIFLDQTVYLSREFHQAQRRRMLDDHFLKLRQRLGGDSRQLLGRLQLGANLHLGRELRSLQTTAVHDMGKEEQTPA